MITVIAKNFVQENKIDKVLELCKELVELTRKEDGCIKYETHQDINNPTIITMIEEWESQDHLDRHLLSEHFNRIVPLLGPLMVSETEMNIYSKKM